MANLVKFTRTREELNPEKKAKFGGINPEKLKQHTFDIFVNADDVAYVDDGEFGQSTVAHEVKTTIHLNSGTTITVDQSVEQVVKALGAKVTKGDTSKGDKEE